VLKSNATSQKSKMASTLSRLILFLVTLVLPSRVSGQFATLYQFNFAVKNGIKACDDIQWTQVQNTIATAAAAKRRSLANRRRLNGSCTRCGPWCVKSGTGCVIKGRRLEENAATAMVPIAANEAVDAPESANDLHRHLGACDQEMARVTNALDKLAPTLTSATCRSLITTQRNFTCAPTTQDCFVQSFNLWDSFTNSVIVTDFKSGGSFCRGIFVSFEAKANYFIGKMQFVVRGTYRNFWGFPVSYFSNSTENWAPYFLSGNHENGAPGGTFFNPGSYVLTATSEDDPGQAKSVSFQVKNC
jgi:hypothetical protein